jgi:hypothetical protein
MKTSETFKRKLGALKQAPTQDTHLHSNAVSFVVFFVNKLLHNRVVGAVVPHQDLTVLAYANCVALVSPGNHHIIDAAHSLHVAVNAHLSIVTFTKNTKEK